MSPVESLKTHSKFKKTEIGAIPVDWELVKLRDICSLNYGEGLPEDKRITGPYPVYGSNGVVGYHNEHLVKGPGIIVGRKGTVGCVTWSDTNFWPIDTTFYLEWNNARTDAHYLYYQLQKMNLERLNISTGVPGLNRDLAGNMGCPLPSLQEQNKIAAILLSVDAAIEKIDVVIKKTKQLKKGLMYQLLTRGIGHTKFKKTEIGKIPAEWRIKKLQEVAAIERGKFQHRPRNEPRFYGGKYPFVQTGDVTTSNGRITSYAQTLNDDGLAISRIFPKGTILITIAANIGETAIAEFDVAFPDSLVGIIAKDKMDNRFLEYYLRTRKAYFNSVATQSAQKNINLETLKPHPVPVPPKEEQVKIADILTADGEEIEKETLQKKNLENLKNSLMDILLTGKVRIRS